MLKSDASYWSLPSIQFVNSREDCEHLSRELQEPNRGKGKGVGETDEARSKLYVCGRLQTQPCYLAQRSKVMKNHRKSSLMRLRRRIRRTSWPRTAAVLNLSIAADPLNVSACHRGPPRY